MTLRVFSRRFLIPAKGDRQIRRHRPTTGRLSRGTVPKSARHTDVGKTPDELTDARSPLPRQADQTPLAPHLSFFSPASPKSRLVGTASVKSHPSRNDRKGPAVYGGASSSSLSKAGRRLFARAHPLLPQLTDLLHSGKSTSEEVWNVYSNLHLHEAPSDSQASELNFTLAPALHQHALRVMTPEWDLRRDAKLNQVATREWRGVGGKGGKDGAVQIDSADGTGKTAYHPPFPRADPPDRINSPFGVRNGQVSFREYERRVAFVFKEMSKTSQHMSLSPAQSVPTLQDFAYYMHKAGLNGSISQVVKAWKMFNTKLTELRAVDSTLGGMPEVRQAGLLYGTYKSLILGLVRHTARGVERSRRSEMQQLHRERKGRSNTSAHLTQRIQERVVRESKDVIDLNAQRALDVLSEMQSKGLHLDESILSLAARCFRYGKGLEKLYKFVQTAFGIDLNNLDDPFARAREGGKGTLQTDTLNTILMALGEQSTASRMMAVYEVLVRPTHFARSFPPNASADAGDELSFSRSSDLFKTDFAGVFKSLKKREQAADGSEAVEDKAIDNLQARSPPSAPYPHWIRPSKSTYNALLEHLCSSVTSSSLGFVHTWDKELKEEDNAKREKGHYALLARYLIAEQLQTYEEELKHLAMSLGVAPPLLEAQMESKGSQELQEEQDREMFDERGEAAGTGAAESAKGPTQTSESVAAPSTHQHPLRNASQTRQPPIKDSSDRIDRALMEPQSHSQSQSQPAPLLLELTIAALRQARIDLHPHIFAHFSIFSKYGSLASSLRSIPHLSWLVQHMERALRAVRAHEEVLRAAVRAALDLKKQVRVSGLATPFRASEEHTAASASTPASTSTSTSVSNASANLKALNSFLRDVYRYLHELSLRAESLHFEHEQRSARLLALQQRRKAKKRARTSAHFRAEEEEAERSRMEEAARTLREEERRMTETLRGHESARAE